MVRPRLRRVLSTALALSACLFTLPGIAGAAPRLHGAPPGVDPLRPTVSGRLIAKPITGEGNAGAVCRDREAARAAMVNRGLVICTDEGRLVLLVLSPRTGFFNRDWNRMPLGAMTDGDHINAWGVLTASGFVLNPTAAVQDISKPQSRSQMVSGILVAKPLSEGGSSGPVICKDRDRTAEARVAMVNRGLVLCTEEGRLILVQLSSGTRILARDGTTAAIANFVIGDRVLARGLLNGVVLNPTYTVEDTDIQARDTNSQDFISGRDPSLTLYVLESDAGGPVVGVVHAWRGPDAHVVLCSGRTGSWGDLRQGMTVDISSSIFNRRIMVYVDTEAVRVVSCR